MPKKIKAEKTGTVGVTALTGLGEPSKTLLKKLATSSIAVDQADGRLVKALDQRGLVKVTKSAVTISAAGKKALAA